jgi:hypothetical protein
MNFRSWLHAAVLLSFLWLSCWAQAPDSNQKLAEQAQKSIPVENLPMPNVISRRSPNVIRRTLSP